MWPIAVSGVRAHRVAFTGTALVLALAAAVVAVTGVLAESGVRLNAAGDTASGSLLVALASSYAGTALVVVVMVVAATVSLTLRGRRREFALLRAVGTTPTQVRRAVTLEVLMVTGVAAPVGAVGGLFGARLLDPLLVRAGLVAPDFTSGLSPLPVLLAVLLVLATAVPVGRLAARESARLAPTAALQQSAVEPRRVGPARRVSALTLTVAGLAAAFSPLFVPGTVGGATAAVSAFLLIGAVALAGPVLVGWLFDRLARLPSTAGTPAVMLAVRNVRGFSRRLTTVVVPLALVVATATVQTSVDRAVSAAAAEQLAATLDADLVVTSGQALTPDTLAQVAQVPGVASVAPLASVPAQVRTDDDAGPGFAEALAWEATALGVVPMGSELFDPGVTAGSLADLAAPNTVAVSSDAMFETGAALGRTLTLRLGDDVVDARVVAEYSRGLGAGGLLTGPATAEAHGLDVHPGSALVDVAAGAGPQQVASALAGLGLAASDVATHVEVALQAGEGENVLSTALLLLLVLVAVGAATTLALTTSARRDELTLLHRTGTTRRQLTAMTTVESLVTGVTAWAVGTVAVVPAVVGVSAGLLGGGWPVVDLPAYAVASAGVVGLALVATGIASRRTTRSITAAVAA